jgi:hypothetical protein
MNWSILYIADGTIFLLGPFKTEQEALGSAKDAQAEGEFDILDQNVYLLCPNHQLIDLSEADLNAEKVSR